MRGLGAASQHGERRAWRAQRVAAVLGAHDGAVEAGRREGQLDVCAVEFHRGRCTDKFVQIDELSVMNHSGTRIIPALCV